MPTGGIFGTSATDLFCSGVAAGSKALTRLVRNPLPLLLLLTTLGALVVYATVKATWTPVAPLRLGHRRAWGQILAAAGRMYVKRPRLFLGLGLLFLPIVVVITLLQWLIFELLDLVGAFTGEVAGGGAFLALVVGTTLRSSGSRSSRRRRRARSSSSTPAARSARSRRTASPSSGSGRSSVRPRSRCSCGSC